MSKLRKLLSVIITLLVLSGVAYGQGGNMGSTSSPVTNRNGQAVSGVSIGICQPLATTAASVTSNVAVLTMASNPITAGYVQGRTIMVAGFTGGDTYFNAGSITAGVIANGYTILSVTATTITYSLVHANAAAGTNGTVLQMGNTITSCAGISTVYSNALLTTAATNPLTSDGNGNWNVFATPGVYYAQFYGTGITTTLKTLAVACVPSSTCSNVTTTLILNGATSGTLTITPPAIAGSSTLQFGVTANGAAVITFPAVTDTVVVRTNPVLNGTPTGTGLPTTVIKRGSGGGTYVGPADTNFHDVDAANLSYTVTIPVGWVLVARASGEIGTNTVADYAGIQLADGGVAILGTGRSPFSSTLGASTIFSADCVIVGDGASHTVRVQAKAFTAAHTYSIENSSTTFSPAMVFSLYPSN